MIDKWLNGYKVGFKDGQEIGRKNGIREANERMSSNPYIPIAEPSRFLKVAQTSTSKVHVRTKSGKGGRTI